MSGRRVMSDSSTEVKPAIDEPSKAKPSAAVSSVRAEAGTVSACSVPGTSVNRMSRNSTPSSRMKSIRSAVDGKDTTGVRAPRCVVFRCLLQGGGVPQVDLGAEAVLEGVVVHVPGPGDVLDGHAA